MEGIGLGEKGMGKRIFWRENSEVILTSQGYPRNRIFSMWPGAG